MRRRRSRVSRPRDARLAKAGNARERAFGAAVESFLDGSGSLFERGRAFGAAMAAWSTEAPADVEAAAFAARRRAYTLRYAPPAERVEDTERAIALAERVVAANPEHPGGIHYLIHATDSPRYAARGLAAAASTTSSRRTPITRCTCHRTSICSSACGRRCPRRTSARWAASRAWVARGQHGLTELGWHSLEWLEYGYLQEGRYREARALVDTARQILAGASADTLAGKPDARYAGRNAGVRVRRGNQRLDLFPPCPPIPRRWRRSRSARRRFVSARWPRRPRLTSSRPRWAGTT